MELLIIIYVIIHVQPLQFIINKQINVIHIHPLHNYIMINMDNNIIFILIIIQQFKHIIFILMVFK